MKGLERLDEMIFHVIESVATGKDIKAEDIEYAARDLYPQHANLLILIIQNKPEFMELWGRKPSLDEMHMAVVEALPRGYSGKQFAEAARRMFPHDWEPLVDLEREG